MLTSTASPLPSANLADPPNSPESAIQPLGAAHVPHSMLLVDILLWLRVIDGYFGWCSLASDSRDLAAPRFEARWGVGGHDRLNITYCHLAHSNYITVSPTTAWTVLSHSHIA